MYYEKMKEVREKAGHSQRETAEALGITKQQYSQYELGKIKFPITLLRDFCLFYNVSSDWILHLSE